MLEKKEAKYDPAIYGHLRAKFLQNVDITSIKTSDDFEKNEEKRRQELIQDIRRGKLVIGRH